jgi:hypothetical protein
MNRKIRFFLLNAIMLVLVCCQNKSNRQAGMDLLFQDFLNDLPHQSLPMYLKCGLPDQSTSCRDYEKYKSFIPKSVDRIFCKIDSKNDAYKLIIYGYSGDHINPVLFSFDNKGQIKDSLMLFMEGCGGSGEKEIPDSFVYIHDYLAIQLIDTTRLVHYPGSTGGDYIVDSLRISRQTFVLNDDGKIVVATFSGH